MAQTKLEFTRQFHERENNQCKYVVIILTKQKPCILGNYKNFPEKILSGMKMKKMYVGG